MINSEFLLYLQPVHCSQGVNNDMSMYNLRDEVEYMFMLIGSFAKINN